MAPITWFGWAECRQRASPMMKSPTSAMTSTACPVTAKCQSKRGVCACVCVCVCCVFGCVWCECGVSVVCVYVCVCVNSTTETVASRNAHSSIDKQSGGEKNEPPAGPRTCWAAGRASWRRRPPSRCGRCARAAGRGRNTDYNPTRWP